MARPQAESKWNWMQIKVSTREAEMIKELTALYGFRDRSMLVRIILAHIARTMPNLVIAPQADAGTESEERNVYIQMKLRDAEEREALNMLARAYGLDISNFIRLVIHFISNTRPKIVIGPEYSLDQHMRKQGAADPAVFIERIN